MAVDTVEKLVYPGLGIIRSHQGAVFVEGVLPQEKVEYEPFEQKKTFARASLLKVVHASVMRTTPKCSHFGSCGGCQLQHAAPQFHDEIKKQWLADALHGICVENELEWLGSGAHLWHWRTKVTFHAFVQEGVWKVGLYRSRFARTAQPCVALSECPIFFDDSESSLFSDLEQILNAVFPKEALAALELSLVRIGSGESSAFSLHLAAGSIGMRRHLSRSESINALKRAVSARSWVCQASVAYGSRYILLKGRAAAKIAIGSRSFSVPPHLFMQNHQSLSRALWEDVAEALFQKIGLRRDGNCFLELYAGVGPISMLLRDRCPNLEVHAVELSAGAASIFQEVFSQDAHSACSYAMSVEDALSNNSILMKALESGPSNRVVWSANPPRDGMSPFVVQRLASGAAGDYGVYTSCDPSTLRRDLQEFVRQGWKVSWAKGYDLFPMTGHFESVVVLSRSD